MLSYSLQLITLCLLQIFLPEHIKSIFINVPHTAAPCDEIEEQRDLNTQSRTSMPPSQVKLCLKRAPVVRKWRRTSEKSKGRGENGRHVRNVPRMLDELVAFSVVAGLACSQMNTSPSGVNERPQIRLCRHSVTHK